MVATSNKGSASHQRDNLRLPFEAINNIIMPSPISYNVDLTRTTRHNTRGKSQVWPGYLASTPLWYCKPGAKDSLVTFMDRALLS